MDICCSAVNDFYFVLYSISQDCIVLLMWPKMTNLSHAEMTKVTSQCAVSFNFPLSSLLFPPGHRHLYDPGGGHQKNPQRRVSVLPLQPRALVKTKRGGTPSPLSTPPTSGHLAGTFGHILQKGLKRPRGFLPIICDCSKVTPTHCL